MIRIRPGYVVEIIKKLPDLIVAIVSVDGEEAKAIHYPQINGPIEIGQKVILNTTAKFLRLGTGGYHFILFAEGNEHNDPEQSGHIMKLRYTPGQLKVLSVEEQDSPHHQKLANACNLAGMPVVVAPLHSMVTPIIAVSKSLAKQAKIVYLMSDGGALPLAFSNLIRSLKERGWISATITFGHAFGGDYEAVNVYSGLLTAKWVLDADIAVIAMGPGIVGTNTPYGFTGVEQADFLHAVHLLAGEPIAVPRISFADERPRHQGISHHSRTVLGQLTLVRSKIAVPRLIPEREKLLEEQLIDSQIKAKHFVSNHSTIKVEEILQDDSLNLRTMGRNFSGDKEFFLTAGLAGKLATQYLNDE